MLPRGKKMPRETFKIRFYADKVFHSSFNLLFRNRLTNISFILPKKNCKYVSKNKKTKKKTQKRIVNREL